jgi:CheY-like chemotaxis protein
VPTELRALVMSVADLFIASAHAKHLMLRHQVGEQVPRWVLADAQRLRQVLLNLVGNAVKFTDQGEVSLSVSVVPEGLRFEVRDTGIGISAASLGGLFEPFHQVHADSDRSHGGTGLGLAISQRLVQAMGGLIDVHSVPGAGACFGFSLRLEEIGAPESALEAASRPAPQLPHLHGRVLLVEDNEVNRMLAIELLQLLHVDVVVAENGAQALDLLAQAGCDLVLMDCQMPGIDGYETTRQWRLQEADSGRSRLPVLAVTANVMTEDFDRARAAGMDDFLGKPYSVEQLAAMLQRWLPAPQLDEHPA